MSREGLVRSRIVEMDVRRKAHINNNDGRVGGLPPCLSRAMNGGY
jgi:hypothetical protein